MGLFDRFRRRHRDEPEEAAPGLFTARSGTLPPTLLPPAADDREPDPDLWDEPTPDEPAPPAAVAAVEELVPPQEPDAGAVTPVPPVDLPAPTRAIDDGAALWDEASREEPPPAEPSGAAAVPLEGSTAEEPLFGEDAGVAAEPPPAPTEPVPPLFEPPEVAAEPEPTELAGQPAGEDRGPSGTVDDEGRTMRVHDGRLDTRPGPIKMTPSEAIALAQEGPRALRRRTHPDH